LFGKLDRYQRKITVRWNTLSDQKQERGMEGVQRKESIARKTINVQRKKQVLRGTVICLKESK
jgi:hypothetical protein